MDPIQLKKFMMKKAQCALKRIGPTDRSRWVIISPFDELTPSQFSSQLMKYDVSINPEEVKTMWETAGIFTPTINFEGFVKLLYYNMPLSLYDTTLSFFDSLVQFRNVLLMWFTANDPNCTGNIEDCQFREIVRKVRPATTDMEFDQLIKQYDQAGTGTVNYFVLLSDLASHISSSGAQTMKKDNLTTNNLWIPPSQSTTPVTESNEVTMNRLNLPAVLFPSARGPGNGGRGPVDPEIFPEFMKPYTSPTRRNSFSEIRGAEQISETKETPRTPQRPSPMQRTPQKQSPMTHKLSSETPLRTEHDAANLAQKIQQQGGAQQFFNKWQQNGQLGVNEIHEGLFADIEYDFPIEKLRTIVNGNGGPFNLSEFVAFNSTALRKPVSPVDLVSLRKQTEEDVVLTRLAERTYGKMWVEAVQTAITANDFAKGLQNVQVFVCADDIRRMFEQNGKDAFITSIRDKQREMFSGK